MIGNGGSGGNGGNGLSGGFAGRGGSLYGHSGAAGVSPTGVVPLKVTANAPDIYVSVDGAPSVPVLVDTGSSGLVVPLRDVGLLRLASLGVPAFTSAHYGDGINALCLQYQMPVGFGNGIASAPTGVNVAYFTYPTSLNAVRLMLSGHTWSPAGAAGIWGMGPNANGSGPTVTTSLPGDLNEGVLINEPRGYLEFGPNPLPAITAVSGAPWTTVQVSVNGQPYPAVRALIDTGSQVADIPASFGIGSVGQFVPPGTLITVYTSDGTTPLFTYQYGHVPRVHAEDYLNTGNYPFLLGPIYMSNSPSGGTTIFDQQVA